MANDKPRGKTPQPGDVGLSRRQVLAGGLGAGAAVVLGALPLARCHDDASAPPPAPGLAPGFTAVPRNTDDTVTIPDGYAWHVLIALGDPIDDVQTAWAGDGTETAASYEHRAGDHHDAIAYFGLAGEARWDPGNSRRGVLVTNHEALTPIYLHHDYDGNTAPRVGEQALKELNAHGVSVVEIARDSGEPFAVVRTSPLNRRYTAQSAMRISGPVTGSGFVVTRHAPDGVACRGTVNNCAHGETPWGTFLSGEENWAGYFGRGARDDDVRAATDAMLLNRYGIPQGAAGQHRWHTVADLPDTDQRFSRWNASATATRADLDYRNEANTMGWVVEIDPFEPQSTPRKRSALGRLAHEGAWFAPAVAGKPLVLYMGDDARNEYIYKFVSTENWNPADIGAGMAAGDKYLDKGTLYVARFDGDSTGRWLPLLHGTSGLDADNARFPFTSQAAVLVATRLAADHLGATKMDRPEWGCVNPRNGEVYMALTNNSSRAAGTQDAANPRSYDADTGSYGAGQDGNVNGHIVRWRENADDPAALSFAWDIYAFASRAAYPANVNLSLLDDTNDMSGPDGIWFDARGMLWIRTDDGAYTQPGGSDSNATNCMMLAATPGAVGDGAAFDVPAGTAGKVRTYVGKAPGATLRRFLVGPKGCEITGVCMTPDNKTMFVNIQHPGEGGSLPPTVSNWPDGGSARPRSATIVITRDDGGEIGVA